MILSVPVNLLGSIHTRVAGYRFVLFFFQTSTGLLVSSFVDLLLQMGEGCFEQVGHVLLHVDLVADR